MQTNIDQLQSYMNIVEKKLNKMYNNENKEIKS